MVYLIYFTIRNQFSSESLISINFFLRQELPRILGLCDFSKMSNVDIEYSYKTWLILQGARGLTFSVITAVDTRRLDREVYAYKLVGKKHQSASDKPTRHIDVAKKLKGITVHKESHPLYMRRSHNCCKISRVSRGSQTTSHTQVTFQAREIEKHYWQLRQQGAYTLRQCKINSKIKPGPIPLTSCNVEHKLMGEGDATLQQHWLTLAAINQILHSWLFSK